jgi:hypothetical protein
MVKISNIWLIALMLTVVLSVIICSASAADNSAQAPSNAPLEGGPGMDRMLQNLTERGYDVKNIQETVKSGDNETAKKLLDEFWTAHPETKPQRPQMSADQLKEIVTDLAGKGKDISKIQAALDSGNITEAQKLLDEFWKANPDLRPAPQANGEKPPK